MAATYRSDHTQKDFGDLLNKVTAFILLNISWIGIDFLDPAATFESVSKGEANVSGKSVRVLDYACGPGTITNALAGYASEFVGFDISPNMANEYNQRFATGPESQLVTAKAYQANLIDPEGTPQSVSGPEFFNFDLAAVGLGFHHFDNLQLSTNRLVERLKPGGVLLIVDFLTHAKNDLVSDASHTVAHHGFGEAEVQKLFSEAGLEDIQFRVMDEPVFLRGTAKRTVFLARGKKPLQSQGQGG